MPEAASQTQSSTGAGLAEWQAGVLAGILGGVVMAVIYSLFQPSFLTETIPSLYGLEGGVVGWTLHVSHAAILGVAFAFGFDAVEGGEWTLAKTTFASIVFTLVVWAFVALLVDPLWIWSPGTRTTPSPVDVTLVGFVAHLAFGVVVGVAAARLH